MAERRDRSADARLPAVGRRQPRRLPAGVLPGQGRLQHQRLQLRDQHCGRDHRDGAALAGGSAVRGGHQAPSHSDSPCSTH